MIDRLKKMEELLATLQDLNGLTARTLRSIAPEVDELRAEAHGQLSLPLDGEKGRQLADAPGADAPVGVAELEAENSRLHSLLAELHRLARDAQWAAVMRKLEAEISGVTEGGTAAA